MRLGDAVEIETPSRETARYRVIATAVLDARDVAGLTPRGDDSLTLITCWPFDALVPGGPLRYVVEAEREVAVHPTPAAPVATLRKGTLS
jgi:sortase A